MKNVAYLLIALFMVLAVLTGNNQSMGKPLGLIFKQIKGVANMTLNLRS